MTGGSGGGGMGGTSGTVVVPRDASPDVDAKDTGSVVTPIPPKINFDNGYATIDAGNVVLMGFVTTNAGGSGTSIALTCTEDSFCASGTVGTSSTYNSWANVGFNVKQPESGGSGSLGSVPFVGSSITISYVNEGGSALQLSLWDGFNFWCFYLPPSKVPNTINIPFSKLNTSCWDGTGSTFVSGTPVEMVQLTVPGSSSAPTPFDYCFLGMTIQ